MKSITIATMLVASLLACCSVVSAFNITFGTLGPNDRLLADDLVYQEFKPIALNMKTVTFTQKDPDNCKVLSAIRLTNWVDLEKFGFLVSGGPGSCSATLRIRGENFKHLSVYIEYFTRDS